MTQSNALDFTHYARRNRLAFFIDHVLFGLTLSIANSNTTLPAFVAELTDSKVLVGAVGAVWLGGWLLPQIVAANYLSDKTDKWPHLIGGSWVGRPFFWLFALYLMLGGARHPGLTLALFLVGLSVFVISDAYVALAWFDLLGKAMPSDERGRVLGGGQLVQGVLAIGTGWLVNHLLSEAGPGFPTNYALIFGLAGLTLMGSLLACYFIVELPGETKERIAGWREYLPQLRAVFQQDKRFVQVTVVRLIAGLHGMAAPFYVIFATQVAGLPESAIGGFLIAQTIGVALAGLGFGWVAARSGSQRVIQISVALEVVMAGVALWMAWAGSGAWLGWIFLALYVALGVVEGSIMLGYLNYTLDLAPDDSRPLYMGLTNTLSGLLVVMPLLGGWLLEFTSSYALLFGLTAAGILPALILAFALPRPARA